jgi:hypothetical protein
MISRPRMTMAEMIEVNINSPEVAENGDAAASAASPETIIGKGGRED